MNIMKYKEDLEDKIESSFYLQGIYFWALLAKSRDLLQTDLWYFLLL